MYTKNILFLILSITACFSYGHEIEYCNEIDNKPCKIIPEQIDINNSEGIVQKTLAGYEVKLLNESIVTLADKIASSQYEDVGIQTYGLKYCTKNNRFCVFAISYYESSKAALVDRRTGLISTLDNIPVFSPDSLHFVVAENSGGYSEESDTLKIFDVNDSGFKNSLDLKPDTWAAQNPVWISNTEVHVERVTTDYAHNRSGTDGEFRIKLSSTKWNSKFYPIIIRVK